MQEKKYTCIAYTWATGTFKNSICVYSQISSSWVIKRKRSLYMYIQHNNIVSILYIFLSFNPSSFYACYWYIFLFFFLQMCIWCIIYTVYCVVCIVGWIYNNKTSCCSTFVCCYAQWFYKQFQSVCILPLCVLYVQNKLIKLKNNIRQNVKLFFSIFNFI